MIKVEDIIKKLIQELKLLYPTYKVYIGTLQEKATYPCFLLYLGLNNARMADTNTIKKTLSADVVYFNSNKKRDDDNYIAKVRVSDLLEEKFLSKLNLKVKDTNIKMDYNIADADDLLNIELKFTYFNNIAKETIDYELMYDFIYRLEIK